MLFYHLDRSNTFPSNSKEQLYPVETQNTLIANQNFQQAYPYGISKTGKKYLDIFEINKSDFENLKATCENFRIYTIEYIFEIIRQNPFPNIPSRFSSLFACQTREDICLWYNILKTNQLNIDNATVKIIDANNGFFIGDAQWRDEPFTLKEAQYNVFSPFAYHERAYNYWNGNVCPDPRIEVLCNLPVAVLDSIPIAEFLNNIS